MMREGGGPAIGVTVKDMTTFLPNRLETEAEQYLLHCFEVNNGKSGHAATSIC